MSWIHCITAVAFVVAILAQPLQGAWWYVCAKPGMELIGKFWLPPSSYLEVPVDTRLQCLKLDETTELIPDDMKQVITVVESQTVMDGKSVDVVTISISKEKIKERFAKQKYKYNLKQKTFELTTVAIE